MGVPETREWSGLVGPPMRAFRRIGARTSAQGTIFELRDQPKHAQHNAHSGEVRPDIFDVRENERIMTLHLQTLSNLGDQSVLSGRAGAQRRVVPALVQ